MANLSKLLVKDAISPAPMFVVKRDVIGGKTYSTIQSAIEAANIHRLASAEDEENRVDTIVYVYPRNSGNWIEDITLYNGISLVGVIPPNTFSIPKANFPEDYFLPVGFGISNSLNSKVIIEPYDIGVLIFDKDTRKSTVANITFQGKDEMFCCVVDDTGAEPTNLQFINCHFESNSGSGFFYQNPDIDKTKHLTVSFKDCMFLTDMDSDETCFIMGSTGTDFDNRSSFLFENCKFINSGPIGNGAFSARMSMLEPYNLISISNCEFINFTLNIHSWRTRTKIDNCTFNNKANSYSIFDDKDLLGGGDLAVTNCTFLPGEDTYAFGSEGTQYGVIDRNCHYFGNTLNTVYNPDYVGYSYTNGFSQNSGPEFNAAYGGTSIVPQGVLTVLVNVEGSSTTTITLPEAISAHGQTITISDTGGNASSGNVTFTNAPTDITQNYQTLTYKSIQSGWVLIGNYYP